MVQLIKKILDRIPRDAFTDTELAFLIEGSAASRHNQIKRALAKGDIIQIRRGLYYLAKRYQRQGLNLYELASMVYGPSYVSFESALSYHGLIPEAVYSISSASAKRSREFSTPLATFSYTQIPLRAFLEGVERIEEKGHIFLIASPLKALTDYVWAHRLHWKGLQALQESLRIDIDDLKFSREDIDDMAGAYQTKLTSHFLEGIKKDLRL